MAFNFHIRVILILLQVFYYKALKIATIFKAKHYRLHVFGKCVLGHKTLRLLQVLGHKAPKTATFFES